MKLIKAKVYRPNYSWRYLDNSIEKKLEYPEGHILRSIITVLEEEYEEEKKEIEAKRRLSKESKIKEGIMVEGALLTGFDNESITVDLLGQRFNSTIGKPVMFGNSQLEKGFIKDFDGVTLTIETEYGRFLPKGFEAEIDVSEDFGRFSDRPGRFLDSFYTLYRSPKYSEILFKKLEGESPDVKRKLANVSCLGNLNSSQIDAVNHCINNSPVNLVQGPPGTGKSMFTAELAHYLQSAGLKVLITAFTHDAINNILEKLIRMQVACLKIGYPSRSSDPLKDYTIGKKNEIRGTVGANPIMGMTVHTLLKEHQSYDYIIVDEASQMDIGSGCHLLASSKKTVFIGDQMQLPNISKSNDPEFSVSIFDLLLKTYSPVVLKTTYRFNQEICNYLSPTFYKDKLFCSDLSKDRFFDLKVKSEEFDPTIFGKQSLVFLDCGEKDQYLYNVNQANVTVEIVNNLIKSGFDLNYIGIIAPTNMQVNLIKTFIYKAQGKESGILVDTVNKFQGQEREVIIYNTVVSDPQNKNINFDFYFDLRRFNVAISRAKTKCFVLGSSKIFNLLPEVMDGGIKIQNFLNFSLTVSLGGEWDSGKALGAEKSPSATLQKAI